jgi:anti-anti-sigma factor
MKQIQESRRALHIETRGEAIVVSPEGVCDLECTRALEGIIGQIDDGTRKNIVLDASHLKYIETPGFRWIVDRFRKLQELGGSLVIAGLAGPAERAFKLLQLDRFIPAAATVEAALARIRRPAKNDEP